LLQELDFKHKKLSLENSVICLKLTLANRHTV